MSRTERGLSASTKRAAEEIGHKGKALDNVLMRLENRPVGEFRSPLKGSQIKNVGEK